MDQRTWSALTSGEVVLTRRTVHGGVCLRFLRHYLMSYTFQYLLSTHYMQISLMAAATVVEQKENGTITPPGRQIFLFLPEPVTSEDLPSNRYQGYDTQSVDRQLLRQQRLTR